MQRRNGFSLLEALLTLSIIGILLAVTIPLLQQFMQRFREQVLQSELMQALALASDEAQLKQVAVTVCLSEDGRHCAEKNGEKLLIFTDENDTGIVTKNTQIIARQTLQFAGGHLLWRAFPRYRDYLHFLASGILRSDNGTFWYCRAQELSPRWALVLNKSARTRVMRRENNAPITDSHGKPLPCLYEATE